MGVGTVTEARETTRGEVRDGGRTLAPQETTFDPTRAKVDPFKARQIQIESLRPVAEAMRRHELATKGIETASATKADIDEIRNGNPDGDGNGNYKGMWRDRNGVWNLPLNSDQLTAEGREEMTRRAMEEIRHRRDRRLAGETIDVRAFVNRETGEDIAAFEGDCEEALLVGRIGENFARAQASVAGDAGAMTSTALGRIGSDNAQLKTLKAVGGDEFDAGAAARERTDLWARQYVRKSLEGRMKAAVVLASQSGGLMSPDAAMKKANAIYDGQASELMRKLVEAGEYDRARTFVGHAEELGYSGAVKAKALEDIDRAEISLATANGLKAYGTVWDENGELIRGRDKVLDAQIATLKRVAENAPKGSRTAIAALQQAERFEDAADSIAYGDLLDDISSGRVEVKDYGKRKDGTKKGTGWLGELQTSDGKVATEYSVGVNIDGKEVEIPTLVPTLTKSEVKTMLDDVIPNKKKVPDEIVRKAALHAKKMIKAGKSPFANDGYSPYQPGTRAARLWPKAVEAWERKETEEYRKNRSLVLGQSGYNAEEFIANDNPQGYLAWLDEQLDKGTISLSDRKAEKDKFMSIWARSPQMKERAKAMLRIVKEELGADFGSAIKGGQDNPEFDKDGSLIVKKGAELPEVTYGRRVIRASGPYPFQREDWSTERFSGKDFKYIMDHSLQFAVADGLKVPIGNVPNELQWMVSDEDRRNGYRTVNCVNDFGAFVRRLALEKRIKAIKNRKSTEYMRLEGELKTLGTSPEEYMGITNTGYLRRQMH